MKITEQDYQTMKQMIINKYSVEQIKQYSGEYKKNNLSDMRFRWDVWRSLGGEGLDFTCDVLYKYLNDDHIDTALKNIVANMLNN